VLPDGTREIPGLWIENTEGARFWMKVFNDLKTRGVADILIAVTDGLKGMPEALAAVYPATTLQTCIVHLIRNSLDYASWKERKALAAALRPIYPEGNAEVAQSELDAFEQGMWGQKFPTVVASWRRAWGHVIPFFAFPPAVRKVIYTTNAIESVNARLRKIIKTRGHFPTDEAATKLIYLALRNITSEWGRAAHDWKTAMNQFAILYDDRFTRQTRQNRTPTLPPRRSLLLLTLSSERRRGKVSQTLHTKNLTLPISMTSLGYRLRNTSSSSTNKNSTSVCK
jgi:putative transposase